MSIRSVIFLIFVIQLGLCNGQHVRHERTRYMTGRDRIYSNYQQNNIPTVHNWDRPLQLLESNVHVPKTYSSRPLFSWDDYRANRITTPGSTRYYSHVSPTVSTVRRYPKKYYSPQERSTYAYQNSYIYNSYPYYNKTREVYPQKVHQEHSGSKGVIYRNSRVYNYDPTRSPGVSKSRYGWSNYQKGYRRRKYCKIGSDGICRRIYTYSPYGYYYSSNEVDRTTRAPRRYRHSEEDLFNEKDESKSLNEVIYNEDGEKDKLCSEKKCEQICKYEDGEAVCDCLEGYALNSNGANCTDINECEIDNGNCGDGTCINTIGSRKCICNEGFRFSDDKCVDVNECLLRNGHGPCQDKCTNTRGSYVCSCENLPGTRLGDDKISCEDVNECDPALMGCSHSCVSIVGRNFCTCPEGFELGDDWKTCKDLDECLNLEEMNIRCKYDCINTIGSFHCDVGNEISDTLE